MQPCPTSEHRRDRADGDGRRTRTARHHVGNAQAAIDPAPRRARRRVVVFVGRVGRRAHLLGDRGRPFARAPRRSDARRRRDRVPRRATRAVGAAPGRRARAPTAERATRVARRRRDPHRDDRPHCARCTRRARRRRSRSTRWLDDWQRSDRGPPALRERPPHAGRRRALRRARDRRHRARSPTR